MKKILLVGGEGYIGQELSKSFLKKKYFIQSIDNYTYGRKNIKKKNNSKKFEFINCNLKNKKIISRLLKNTQYVIILAGLVGDPITKKYRGLSKIINDVGIRNLINLSMQSPIKKLIFVSTCSNYGIQKNKKPDEKSKLKPLSHYAECKVKNEMILKKFSNKSNVKWTILRFATAFGVSDRMRFDLTINEFVKEAFYNKNLDVYDKNTWRPYCHIKDFSRVIHAVINDKTNVSNNEIFNVGSNENNFTKKQIIEKIQKKIPFSKISYLKNSKDKRDYNVNFNKIKKKLKFKTKYSVDYGINEIKKYLSKMNKNHSYYKYFGNYKIVNK